MSHTRTYARRSCLAPTSAVSRSGARRRSCWRPALTVSSQTQLILWHNGSYHGCKREIRCEVDRLSHAYRLVLRRDNTYEVSIDGREEAAGSIYDDFDMLRPARIRCVGAADTAAARAIK